MKNQPLWFNLESNNAVQIFPKIKNAAVYFKINKNQLTQLGCKA